MKYFHCPQKYRNKPYGCGAGPFNGTQTFLDFGQMCPDCGKKLTPFRKTKDNGFVIQTFEKNEFDKAVNFIESVFGEIAAENYKESKRKK